VPRPADQANAVLHWREHAGLLDADDRLMLRLADELALQPGASAESMSDLQARFLNLKSLNFWSRVPTTAVQPVLCIRSILALRKAMKACGHVRQTAMS